MSGHPLDPHEFGEQIAKLWGESIKTERAAGMLRLTHEGIMTAMKGLQLTIDVDPELLPEAKAVLDELQEANDAIVRALQFLMTRNEVAFEKFANGEGGDSGTPT
jgi:hypothetical protein